MQIRVIVKTRAKRPGVRQLTGEVYEVAVNAPPIDGRANAEVIEALSKYFNLRKNQVTLVSGFTAVNKTFELSD